MQPPARQTVEVSHTANVGEARRMAKQAGEALGFESIACEEIAMAVCELATNLVKHAGSGSILLTPLAVNGQSGLQIESVDSGPGIADVQQAISDGFSTTGGLGVGLGAINRLMDEFDISSQRHHGTHVVCRKWLRRYAPSLQTCPLAVGAASRPCSPGEVNGDAFVIKHWSESVLVGVLDGLGHGQFAHRAAQSGRQYVETHFDLPMVDIFRGVGRTCRATRGLVMALARFDWARQKMTFASVGNIEARLCGDHKSLNFIVRRGVIGFNAPNPVVSEHAWDPDDVFVLHSDGVGTHWNWQDYPELADKSATVVAERLLHLFAKDNDDATVLVVRRENA